MHNDKYTALYFRPVNAKEKANSATNLKHSFVASWVEDMKTKQDTVYANQCLWETSCLYECETWSLTLREEHRLRVFEKRVLRRIFGPKRDKMTREWRKLHNEELHNLYSSPDIIRQVKSRRMRWAGHVARVGEERKVYKVLVGKSEGKDHSEDQGVGGRMVSK
jgi:hypothetical protein